MCSPATQALISSIFANESIELEDTRDNRQPSTEKATQLALVSSPFTPSPPSTERRTSLEDRLIDEFFGEGKNADQTTPYRASKEYREVIRGSKIPHTQQEAKPKFLSLGLPNCFSPTPLRNGKPPSEISAIEIEDADFLLEFDQVYQELTIHMEFNHDVLLKYSFSQRKELGVSIDLFLSNIHRVNDNESYNKLFDEITNLFSKPELAHYFEEEKQEQPSF